jgi:hypothetical protein
MENHPIPQDITGFQFKLIGDMTVKQFAYVAIGGVLAWLTYILPLPFIIRLPVAIIFAGIGLAFAFMPVEGRPMDAMIGNFFKAVFSPTQYVYQKTGGQLLSANPFSAAKTAQKVDKLDKKEMVFFQSLTQNNVPLQDTATLPAAVPDHAFAKMEPTVSLQPLPQQQDPNAKQEDPMDKKREEEEINKAAATLEKELKEAKEKEAKEKATGSADSLEYHQKAIDLQNSLNELMLQKQQLETKLIELQQQLQNSGKSVYSPSVAQPELPKETQYVRSIPQNMTKSAGLLSASDFPNVITGIVKDPRGNPLANILVEVKDSQGNAARAFKTNALGQFASATPLQNGDYTISFDDPRVLNKFDTVAFKASGQPMLPIEVISVDPREELRRSLFS